MHCDFANLVHLSEITLQYKQLHGSSRCLASTQATTERYNTIQIYTLSKMPDPC